MSDAITRLKQIHLDHGKEGAENGDCHRTAIACLLGYSSVELVPHWWRKTNSDEEGAAEMREWLESIGLRSQSFYNGDWSSRLDYHLLSGPSPRLKDTLHCVVGYGGKPIHDPHPDNSMLIGDPDEWLVDLIIPIRYAGIGFWQVSNNGTKIIACSREAAMSDVCQARGGA